MIRVISSFADRPVNFNPTGPAEDQTQKLISSTKSPFIADFLFYQTSFFGFIHSIVAIA